MVTLQNDEGTLFKVNGHHLKVFLEPEKPPEDLDEVDFFYFTINYTTTIGDKRCSAVHQGVSHDGRFVVEVSEIRSEMVIQAPRHKI